VPGSGKSEWIESMALNLAEEYDWNTFVYSPENYPLSYHMAKLISKRVKKPFDKGYNGRMSKEEFMAGETFIEKHFEFVSAGDMAYDLDRILYTIKELIRQGSKIDMAIIDPWNELENHRPRTETETDFIGRSLMTVRRFAREQNISFWLVCHPAKIDRNRSGEYPEPSMYDLSGSAHWWNKSDNAIILHRSMAQKKTGCVAKCKVMKIKNRFYGKVGDHFFLYNAFTGRFEDHHEEKPEEKKPEFWDN